MLSYAYLPILTHLVCHHMLTYQSSSSSSTRQLLSIVISCIIYGHTLSGKGIAGIVIVFGTIAVRIYLSYARSRRRTRTLTSLRGGGSLHPTLEKPVSARLTSPHSSSASLAALNRERTPSSP